MSQEAIFILVSKEEAKDSFEARKIVALEIRHEIREFISPPYPMVGGDFSGMLSDLCGGKHAIPYYNKDMRDTIRKNLSDVVPWLKDTIEKQKIRRAIIRVQDLKNKLPELKKYDDAELFDGLVLELAPMGLNINFDWTLTDEPVYIFTNTKPFTVTPDLRENGRDVSLELGYKDDAMIINECLSREVIDKMKGKIINIADIEDGKGALALATKGKLREVKPEDVIGKYWIVLVNIPEYF